MNFAVLPKIELHLHLDCSLSYEVVSRIRPSVTQAEYESSFIAPAKCTNLADFLTRAPKGIELMQTEEQLRLVTEDLFMQLAADNVIYAEVRFAPLLHLEGGLTAEEVVEVVENSASHMSAETGIETRIILCTLRHFSEDQSLQTVRLVERFRGTRVVALDLAADEAGFPVDAHRSAFEYARRENLFRTAHAGEARGAESVWETLHLLHVQRIGHGVRSIEDPRLIEFLRQNKIHLEVCPTCNVQIDVFPSYADHSVARLYNAGVSLGINTDTRTTTNVTLTEEYRRLHATFGWELEEFLQCNLNAVKAAFLPDGLKKNLEARLTHTYQHYQ